MRSPPSSSAISAAAAICECHVPPGMFIGFGMLVIGLLTGLAGILVVSGSPAGSPRRRKGFILVGVGLGAVWIGGFVGAFSSL